MILGMKYSASSIDTSTVDVILNGISSTFSVSFGSTLISMIPLAVVIFMAIKQYSALATMVAASLVAMVIAMLTQGFNIIEMMSFMNYGFVIEWG